MHLIFDFDGTLCDSVATNIAIANKYFGMFGIAPTNIEELRRIGLRGLLQSRRIPKLFYMFIGPISHWEFQRHLPSLNLFPWTAQVIPQLSSHHQLGILTNNSARVVKSILTRHNLDQNFSFIYSQSNIFSKRDSLQQIISTNNYNPAQTYYIGDGIRDIEAARTLGINSIGVTWGFESDELLASAHPTQLISNPSQLLDLPTNL